MPRLILTRPAREAGRWVQSLQQQGLAAETFPLMEIVPLAPEAVAVAWQNLDCHAALMFVSANAVEYFFAEKAINQATSQYQIAKTAPENIAMLAGTRFLAPGPGTVAVLLQAGVPADRIDAPASDASQFDSQVLWQVVGGRNWLGQSVLIVRGESVANDDGPASPGRDWLARQWQAAGASVACVSVYRRQAPVLTAEQRAWARAASHDGSIWLFSSSEAVSHLLKLVEADWSAARAIATHPRIAQTVREAGWGVVVASRPDLHDIKTAWASIESRSR